MLSFVLCDDNQSAIDKLSKMLDSIIISHNLKAQISYTTTNPIDLLQYTKTHPTDVLLLDIDLKSSTSGLQIAEQIREIDKNVYQVYVCHAIAYSDAGRTDLAIDKYKEAITVNPNMPNAYILLGNIYVEQHKYLEALDCYKKASEINPNDAKTYTFIGNTYFMLNDLENAIQTYRTALAHNEQAQENKLVYIEILQEYINRKEAESSGEKSVIS